MGWKQIGGRQYYYRSVREGGRVRSEYVGAGEMAQLAAQIEAIDRDGREAERREWEAERDRFDAEDRDLAEWLDATAAVADAAMMAAGYQKHHRGEWRRKRR